MTRISYIHGPAGVPMNERPDRGREVGAAMYIPYTSMTEGEMQLALLREMASIHAAAYPDYRNYRAAVDMLDNALYAGAHRGVNWVGQMSPDLQGVARAIHDARHQTRPASGILMGRPAGLARGIHIGAPIIPVDPRTCREIAAALMKQKHGVDRSVMKWAQVGPGNTPQEAQLYATYIKYGIECEAKRDIEAIMNARLESSSHHVLYKAINSAYTRVAGTRLDNKRLFHIAGVQGLGAAAEVAPQLMNEWTEVGIMRKNSQVGAGPASSMESGFNVALGGPAEYDLYVAWATKQKRDKMARINALPLVAIAGIITAIAGALTAAAGLLAQINQRKQGVMNAAYGFGTPALSAEKGDLNGNGIPDDQEGIDTTTMVLLGGAAALLLLNED